MAEILTGGQMMALERAAMARGAAESGVLMDAAGRAVFDTIFETWPELHAAPQRAVVLCGPGNNGGDGYVIARLLREWGWEVEVLAFGAPGDGAADAARNAARWHDMGGASRALDGGALEEALPGAALCIDALFGTGARALSGDLAAWVDRLNVLAAAEGALKIVAVDLPSGVSADSGKAPGGAVAADLTVSFHRAKLGHYLADGPAAAGALRDCPIGLPDDPCADAVMRIAPPTAADLLKTSGHKYDYGHALILAGPPGQGGAARMAARGALRIGAGLVTVACPQRAVYENAAQLDAIMLRGIDGPSGFEELLEDARLSALCLGPGLGLGAITAQLVRVALEAGRPTVLDADALTRFSREAERLFDMAHPDCVLTPHEGEFARLFPDLAEEMRDAATETSRADALRKAADRAGCTVLLKGPATLIASPGGDCRLHSALYDEAAPWLATAGAGDVLSGFITGLLARGFAPLDAASNAVWLHTACARNFGPGLIAEDLPEQLPAVFRTL
ncbi:NAD(P)H-hydrate dehydratase [Poseidonocella sedimentorum]|uniref:Bifunctional NAD(P)H-hydrate repair enzyme n=1 Tax=Poseidonocella sedimentorum TaxID=871652 RepID=A0A1I6DZ63_9RHOB|nr:NAD(P)H-hydrate dehydratase [Poseidonocella sedimentorum]SFR10687.1 yjeF C-terminal region, hydroxyethylthiazole kinase-related/yjeF N-terminal region [Poseidonocella sedimentorum]